jgi:hypothetical protein
LVNYRVLVTGSRDWSDSERIWEALKRIDNESGIPDYIILMHGGAKGADTIAAKYAKWGLGWTVHEFPAEWNTHTEACPDWHDGLKVCKMAGHRRNAEMVNYGADICLAFIKNNSPGATGCARLAENAGIPVRYYRD